MAFADHQRERAPAKLPPHPNFSLRELADDVLLTQAEVAAVKRQTLSWTEKQRLAETDNLELGLHQSPAALHRRIAQEGGGRQFRQRTAGRCEEEDEEGAAAMTTTPSDDGRKARLYLKVFVDAHGREPKDYDEIKRWFCSPAGEASMAPYVGVDADGEFFLIFPKENDQ